MTDSEIERLAADYIAADWTPDRYYRDLNLIAFATKLLEHGYAEGRKDEAEENARLRAAARRAWAFVSSPALDNDVVAREVRSELAGLLQ